MPRTRVFTNGCFDLFHDGHRYLFNTILNLFNDCVLGVAINSDRSIRELKGENRPSMCLMDRAAQVEKHVEKWCQKNMEYPELKMFPFDSEENLEVIMNHFDPDVIVKGNDREIKDIKGSNKWPVIVVPRLKNSLGEYFSTTNILKNGHEK